jgi:RNA polymerase sigma factor (sigma-70 family)
MAASVTLFLRNLRSRVSTDEPDAKLLSQFTYSHDDEAFVALVRRHGPMVLGVCRRHLRDPHDVEDAFQATFLVLARKAESVRRPERLAGWLHGVARNVARNARRGTVPVADASLLAGDHEDLLSQLTAREALTIIDEEVDRLPEKYRLPVIWCCLEGLTQEEAARRLGWTPDSVRGRLERGRRLLHERLAKRGLTLSAALAVAEVARGAKLPAGLLRAAVAVRHGGQAPVIALADAVMRGVVVGNLRLAVLVSLVLLTGSVAGVGFAAWSRSDEQQDAAQPAKPATASNDQEENRVATRLTRIDIKRLLVSRRWMYGYEPKKACRYEELPDGSLLAVNEWGVKSRLELRDSPSAGVLIHAVDWNLSAFLVGKQGMYACLWGNGTRWRAVDEDAEAALNSINEILRRVKPR